MSFLKNFHCKILSCGIFAILLLSLITKMKESTSFPRVKNDDVLNILDKYGISPPIKGLPRDRSEAAVHYHYYYGVFQHLAQEGYLSTTSKSLCIRGTKLDQEVNALKNVGISDVIMISGQSFDRFGNNTFDFAFFGRRTSLDFVLVDQPFEIASEVCRILRYGGYLVAHIAVKDEYSFNSLLSLFTCCRLTTFRDIKGLNSTSSIREVVLRKSLEDSILDDIAQGCDNNTVPEYKRDLIGDLEPLEEKEPMEDWTEQGKNRESIGLFRYLPTMVDLIYKRRYIYIDLGAQTYGSTIGNWFKKLYPKQNKNFEIFAIEADKSFHEEYKRKKDVTLLPYAAWIRNETLVFGTRNKKREYTGRIQSGRPQVLQDYKGKQNVVQAFDFADWLIRTFSKQDFVVLKMDVEGTEMDLIPRLVESGAICFIDELFLECHYDRWVKCCSGKRTKRYNSTYDQCFNLFSKLRQAGSLVHQWWWANRFEVTI